MEKLDFFTPNVLGNPGEGLYQKAFDEYMERIEKNKGDIPTELYELVKSNWYFNARDPRCPKDAWVTNISISNDYCTKSKVKLPGNVTLSLLGAYHDRKIHFKYSGVENTEVVGVAGSMTDRDYDPWRIDEFSVNDDKLIRHNIYFLSGTVWTIDFKGLAVDFEQL